MNAYVLYFQSITSFPSCWSRVRFPSPAPFFRRFLFGGGRHGANSAKFFGPRSAIGIILASAACALPQSPRAAAPDAGNDAEQFVKVEKLKVEGSRLEAVSVQMLTGLRLGQQINETSLRKAIQRMLDSGLVKNVDYSYESMSSPNSVLVDLRIVDETPLLPATIELPGVEPEDVWAYLKGVDPLFTRELPRTQKALAFYTRYIERYLFTRKRQDRIATVITANDSGDASGIVFVPASLLGLPQPRKKQ